MTTSRSSWAPPRACSTASGRRPVATTALPAASAALAMSTPIPRPAPVTSQTFLSVSGIDVLLHGWALHARHHLLGRSWSFANALAGHLWPFRKERRPACRLLDSGTLAIHRSAWKGYSQMV